MLAKYSLLLCANNHTHTHNSTTVCRLLPGFFRVWWVVEISPIKLNVYNAMSVSLCVCVWVSLSLWCVRKLYFSKRIMSCMQNQSVLDYFFTPMTMEFAEFENFYCFRWSGPEVVQIFVWNVFLVCSWTMGAGNDGGVISKMG